MREKAERLKGVGLDLALVVRFDDAIHHAAAKEDEGAEHGLAGEGRALVKCFA